MDFSLSILKDRDMYGDRDPFKYSNHERFLSCPDSVDTGCVSPLCPPPSSPLHVSESLDPTRGEISHRDSDCSSRKLDIQLGNIRKHLQNEWGGGQRN